MKVESKIQENILVLTHWSFNDALIQAYTLPYVHIIRKIVPIERKIILVTSEQPSKAISPEELTQLKAKLQKLNIDLITFPYRRIGTKKLIEMASHLYKLFYVIKNMRVTTIHCFCTPAGAIGYLLSKISSVHLILDSYEPHAEAMIENGSWSQWGFAYRLLFLMEKLQTHRARYTIGAALGMRDYARSRYRIDPRNFQVKAACVNLEKFSRSMRDTTLAEELGLNGKIVCVYAGKLGGIYLKEEVFDFLSECYYFWGNRFRFLFLTDADPKLVRDEMKRVAIPEEIVIQQFLPHDQVPRYLALGDFAINPVKPVPTKKYCTSIKDGEYWATGLPVIITKDISDDSNIIASEDIGYVLQQLDREEYKRAIRKIDSLIQSETTHVRIREIAVRYRNFDIAEKIYRRIYSKL